VSTGLVEDRRQEIENGQAVLLVGAGVAITATGGDPRASWTGLLNDALTWCQDHVPGHPELWPGVVRGLLDAGDVESLLTAAELLTSWLGGRGGGEYRRWLHERVGSLLLVDRSLPEALAGLGIPIATTNYDGLIEQASGWGPATWRDGAKIQRALREDPAPCPPTNERSCTSTATGTSRSRWCWASAPTSRCWATGRRRPSSRR
jgi:hypothetical protein